MKLSLNELVAKWRADSETCKVAGCTMCNGVLRCADELEAALAASIAEQTQNDPEFAAAFAKGDAEIRAGLGVPLAASGRAYYEAHPMYDGGVVVPWDELPPHLKADAAASGTEPCIDHDLRIQRLVEENLRLQRTQPTREQIARWFALEFRGVETPTQDDYDRTDAVLAVSGKSEAKP